MADFFIETVTDNSGFKVVDIKNKIEKNPLSVLKNKIQIRLMCAKGEWKANTDFGIGILDISKNSDSKDIIASMISDEILAVPGVIQCNVISDNLDEALRIYNANFQVETIYGTSNLETSV